MDKYDEQIANLRSLSDRDFEINVFSQWVNGEGLFQFMTPSGCMKPLPPQPQGSLACGCLTQIRAGQGAVGAWTMEMTDKIRADERIPMTTREITPESLPVFAEYQREADRTFRVKRGEVPL